MMNFIENAKGLTRNPLGIIALFISLIYGFACLVLSTSISNLQDSSERLPLIWFIICFPIIILIGFVFLVTKHHQKLYSPSDYGNAESFLKTIEGSEKFESVQVDVTKDGKSEFKKTNDLVAKFENVNLNKGIFSPQTKENVALANNFFDKFLEIVNQKYFRSKLSELSFGAQAPEYFILTFRFQKEFLKSENTTPKETVIIRVTRDDSGTVTLIGIGKDIIETNPMIFAEKIAEHLELFASKVLKAE
jgi:ABC-type transport system involved in multi-copper enzyme maturation permease subunit